MFAARERGLLGVIAGLFAASSAVTFAWCGSMASAPGMQMPGGWTMSMAWMRMPGQSGASAALTFIGMWAVMMVAMMLPVLAPMLVRYRRRVGAAPRLASLTWLVASAYFLVWTLAGVVVYPLGRVLAEATMRIPALAALVPLATGITVIVSGALQFTAWKRRTLECCRAEASCCDVLEPDAGTAWRHGVTLGLHCLQCCAGLTALLLVLGVMDLRAMALVTGLVAAERLAPAGDRVARVSGAVLVSCGLWMLFAR
jgi:predicted metal-binding membrane protein